MMASSLYRRPPCGIGECTMFRALSWRKASIQSRFNKTRSVQLSVECLDVRTVPSTLTVVNNLDSGVGSLRRAISDANNGDTIGFAPSLSGQTITLTGGDLVINSSLTSEGPGPNQLAISGNGKRRVFSILRGLTVTIAGLTIMDGFNSQSWKGGGGILNNRSTLTLLNDVLLNNQARAHVAQGGGITNFNGTLYAIDTKFIGNRSLGAP